MCQCMSAAVTITSDGLIEVSIYLRHAIGEAFIIFQYQHLRGKKEQSRSHFVSMPPTS